MQAHLIPDVDQNTCWVCTFRNLPYDFICRRCYSHTTPTRIDEIKVAYQIFSFGSHTNQFPSCQRLHSNLFGEAVQVLQNGRNVAIRVGVGSRLAIIIKDANSTIRSTISGVSPIMKNTRLDTFIQTSIFILGTDPDLNTGRVPPSNRHIKITVLSIFRSWMFATVVGPHPSTFGNKQSNRDSVSSLTRLDWHG
jgi:hypothetical protein